MVFSLEVLSTLMADSAVRGLSITRELQPLGGRGDAVSPPTFAQAVGDEKGPRYVWSERRIGDETVRTCLLDSPASQANRIEESFLDLVHSDKLTCTAPGFLDTHLRYAAWRSSYSSRASSGVRYASFSRRQHWL